MSSSGGSGSQDPAQISEFAKQSVRDLCSQQWVCERSLKDPVMDLIMDTMLTRDQRGNLIQLLCYPDDELKVTVGSCCDDGFGGWAVRFCKAVFTHFKSFLFSIF